MKIFRSSLFILILFVSTVLTACDPAQRSDQPITFMVFGDPAELKAYQDLAAAFEAENLNAKIELIHIPGQSDYRTRLAADFAAGTPADVVLLNYRRIAPYAAKDALEPLDEYLTGSKILSPGEFYPQVLQAFTYMNQLYCIPQNLSSLVVYYNKDLFDQINLPYPDDHWTWGDFLRTAQALTRDLDDDGKIDQYGVGFEVAFARFTPFIWQHGGEITNNDLNPTNLTLDWPASQEAIQWVVELQTRYKVIPNALDEAAEDSESRFMNGRLGMYLNSRRGVPAYRQIEGFDWDVAPLPRDRHYAGILHSDGYCMPTKAANGPERKKLIWEFIEFANSQEGQRIIAMTGRTVPSIKAVAESPVFLDSSQKPANNQGAFLDPIPYIRPLPVKVGWIDAEEAVDEELKRAFYGQTSVEEAIKTAMNLANQYIGFDADAP